MVKSDVCTVPELERRAKADGLPISAYSIRRLIKQGLIPARYIGQKAVVPYSALVRYFQCVDGRDNPEPMEPNPVIRRVKVG